MKHLMRFKLLAVVARSLLLTACIAPSVGNAEDIDLFLTPPSTAVRPNILLMIDNAASNNSNVTLLGGTTGKKLDLLKQILGILMNPLTDVNFPACTVTAAVLNEQGGIVTKASRSPSGCTTRAEADALVSGVNLGLMINNPSGNGQGGYVNYHVRPMDDTNRAALWAKVSPGIPSSNNAPYAKSMHEAYLYFGGQTPYVGFDSNLYDAGAKDGTHYRSPASDTCQSNYILFVGNGGPDSGEINDSRALLTGIGGSTTQLPFPTGMSTQAQSSYFDEYAQALKAKDVVSGLAGTQNITTYTIAVQDPTANNFNTNAMESARALLQSAALAGGGAYALGTDGASVLNAFFSALRKMQPQNSVFAAVTLPVSVNVRGTFLNQVYMGQFRPDENAYPRWPGNLKQYQIARNAAGDPVLADRNRVGVEDTVNGFLLPDSTSFWSTQTSYWGFTGKGASDAPDGSVVEKGGAGQKMRVDFLTATQRTNRKLYTCNGSCGTSGTALSSVNFKADNASASGPTIASLGVADTTERTALIDWVRGADNMNDENKDGSAVDSRAYIHGDLLHSRPAVVNYNRNGDDNDVMVYYGANDGIFHAIKGGQRDVDGGEKWGMVFPEFFSKLKLLRDNNQKITKDTPRPYFSDGTVSIYQNDVDKNGKLNANDNDKVYVYIGMRRGGRFAYALDVSDPLIPKSLWKIDSTMAGFTGLGQTWSTLRPTSIRAVSGDPVVIFGGGYDNLNEDPVPATPNVMGNGIYVVNGRTGALVKYMTATGMGSIPADLTVLDRDQDKKADRIYAPDTKGNVWRVDIADANPDNWRVYKIASLGGSGGNARKFLNKIDILFGNEFDTLLVGSGDRENPSSTAITDRFYMLKDTNIGLSSGGLVCGPEALRVTCTEAHLTDVTGNPYQNGILPTGSSGWFLTFATGEKLVNSPLTVGGVVIFGTNQPSASVPGTCGNLGKARIYEIGYKTGNAVVDLNKDGVIDSNDLWAELPGGGFPPTAVKADIGDQGVVVCMGTHCIKSPGDSSGTERTRTYWYRKQ